MGRGLKRSFIGADFWTDEITLRADGGKYQGRQERKIEMGFLAYLAICVFWGLSSIATKIGLYGFEPFTFSFFRFFITVVVLLGYNLVKRKSLRLRKQDFKVITISAIVMYFLNSAFLMFATKRLDAGLIPILFALVPIVMVVIESVLNQKILVGPLGMIGIIGGVVGIFVVSIGNDSRNGSVDVVGLLLMGCAVLSWAGGSVYLKKKKIETSITTLLMYQMIVPLTFYALLTFYNGGPQIYGWSTQAIIGVFYMALIDTLLGSACYVYLLKRWKVSIVATYAYINPIVGLMGSYFFLNEMITMKKMIGMVIILFSVFLIQNEGRENRIR